MSTEEFLVHTGIHSPVPQEASVDLQADPNVGRR